MERGSRGDPVRECALDVRVAQVHCLQVSQKPSTEGWKAIFNPPADLPAQLLKEACERWGCHFNGSESFNAFSQLKMQRLNPSSFFFSEKNRT